jgi:hypothetical protein
MIDPLTLILVGAGALAFREMNKKDYGVLTAERDERYRVAMTNCQDPQTLLTEAKLFAEYGLKAQSAMLKRRSEWRSRSEPQKKEHENIFQKAMRSKNVAAVLEVAAAFEGWTATKKAAALREHARLVQEQMLQDAVKTLADQESKEEQPSKETPETSHGLNGTVIPQNAAEDNTAHPER